jgi:hypothetical protein
VADVLDQDQTLGLNHLIDDPVTTYPVTARARQFASQLYADCWVVLDDAQGRYHTPSHIPG